MNIEILDEKSLNVSMRTHNTIHIILGCYVYFNVQKGSFFLRFFSCQFLGMLLCLEKIYFQLTQKITEYRINNCTDYYV